MTDHKIPGELKYTTDHEWVKVENDTATVGIDDYAQAALGELVYVELPTVGASFEKGQDMAVVESYKTASDVYAPISGEVIAVNEALADTPQMVNDSPYDKGWLVKLKIADTAELDTLLDADAYAAQLD